MKPTIYIFYLLASLLPILSAVSLPGAQCVIRAPGTLKRRSNLENVSLSPAAEAKELLQKRDDSNSTCACGPQVVYYHYDEPLPYFALPLNNCTPTATTSRLCPTDYICACKSSGTSICTPKSVQNTTECGTANVLAERTDLVPRDEYDADPTDSITEYYILDSAPTDVAAPSGQCGGTTNPAGTTFWATTMTVCPANQICSCISTGFSQCVGTTGTSPYNTACPCTNEFPYPSNFPGPTATAKLKGQCGGSCWPGPTNCPSGATCYTEKSPNPGGYAYCATAKPTSEYKLRKRDGWHVMNVPARARAIATRIFF
ncbi:hypothetical protein H072_976 [Dactylellina haptotyla CBS 200.50]|uniref:CBM1 domain-containing protein n=1 Tax=Dactylellina haptotyla (strain CBS 200.50) TaxID=1284197 RepID=S8APV5_DACHA|nr:hypothetical protein H072_976 [Dactylellina haptotyla CBS 200.50]